VVRFTIEGDLRYLSHQDELRMLGRALRRADWPLAYSQGFNPQPRIRLPLPRNVGIASAAEYALVGLAEARPARALFETLRAVLPAGCRLDHVSLPAPPRAPQPLTVRFTVPLEAGDREAAQERIPELQRAAAHVVRRPGRPDATARDIDIRPFIRQIRLDNDRLVMDLVFDGQRTARPAEILDALGLAPQTYAHRVRRDEVTWNIPLVGRDAWPRTQRTDLGKTQETHEENHRTDTTQIHPIG